MSAVQGRKWTNRLFRPRTPGQFGEENGYYIDTEGSDKPVLSIVEAPS